MKIKYPAIIFFTLIIFAVALPIVYYPQLPDKIASHFNASGRADGWESKNSFIIFQIGITLFLSILFGILAFLIPKFPKSIVSLPNKDYWLNEENRAEAYGLIQKFLLWFGSITIAFITLTFQETLSANLSGEYKLSSRFWIYFAAFIFATILYVIKFILHFSRKNIPKLTDKIK